METNESLPEISSSAQPEPPPSTSVWSRMANVYAAPGEVYDEVKVSPPCLGNWLWPALLIILIGWISSGVILNNESVREQISAMQSKGIEQRVAEGKMTQEQADAAMGAIERFGTIGMMVGGIIGPVFAGFASAFWWALIIWLGGRLIMKGSFTYLKAVEVAGLSNMIVALQAIIKTLLILVTGNMFAGPGLGLFIKEFDGSNPMHSVMAAIDLLTLWVLVVRAIGMSKLSGKSLAVCLAWIFGAWVCFTGCGIAFGVIMTRLFS